MQNKEIGLILLVGILLFSMTGTSMPVTINQLFDGNVSGEAGLIPFLNFDGNYLTTQTGFDFNSDTNTLSADYFVGDGSGLTGIPSPDVSNLVPYTGATTNVDLGANDLYVGGDIGIGTTSPESSLHVNSPAISGQEQVFKLTVDDADNSYFTINNASSNDGVFLPFMKGYNGDDQRSAMFFSGYVADATWNSQYYPALNFSSRPRDGGNLTKVPVVSFTNVSDSVLTTWFDGATKIGGSDTFSWTGGGGFKPTTMLDVININSNDLLNLLDGTTSRVYVKQNGNVGIGTTTPTKKLEVSGSILADGNVYATDFITSSKVAEINDEKALDKLNNIDKWLDNKKQIQYDEHYAHVEVERQRVSGYKIELQEQEVCKEDKNLEINCKIEMVEVEVPIYEDYTQDGLSMETRIAEMEKMIYELKEQNNDLQNQINDLKNTK